MGATSSNECKKPCKAGYFSSSGLEPCSPCPVNFYQPNIGQQKCLECANNTMTKETGRFAEAHCKSLDCSNIKCQNKGTCAIMNHKVLLNQ